MGRRARQLLVFLEDLDERKIDYISIRDGHLTGDSASGKIFRHMLVGMAEYESNLISERTRAGLAAKKARGEAWGGRKKGQRYRLTPEKLQAVKAPTGEGDVQGSARKDVLFGAARVYPVTVPGPKWESWLRCLHRQPYGVHAGLVRYCPCQTRRDAAPTITTTGA